MQQQQIVNGLSTVYSENCEAALFGAKQNGNPGLFRPFACFMAGGRIAWKNCSTVSDCYSATEHVVCFIQNHGSQGQTKVSASCPQIQLQVDFIDKRQKNFLSLSRARLPTQPLLEIQFTLLDLLSVLYSTNSSRVLDKSLSKLEMDLGRISPHVAYLFTDNCPNIGRLMHQEGSGPSISPYLLAFPISCCLFIPSIWKSGVKILLAQNILTFLGSPHSANVTMWQI